MQVQILFFRYLVATFVNTFISMNTFISFLGIHVHRNQLFDDIQVHPSRLNEISLRIRCNICAFESNWVFLRQHCLFFDTSTY